MELENKLALELLGEGLQSEGEGVFSCVGFSFEETDEPVMSRPQIGFPNGKPTERKVWEARAGDEDTGLSANSLCNLITKVAIKIQTDKVLDRSEAFIMRNFWDKIDIQ